MDTVVLEIPLLDLKQGFESNTVLVLLRQRLFLFCSDLKGKRTWKYHFGIKPTENMTLDEKRFGITAPTIGCLKVIRCWKYNFGITATKNTVLK